MRCQVPELETSVFIKGRDHPRFKDIRARNKEGLVVCRKYRDSQISVYRPPQGLAVLDRTRGKKEWHVYLWVATETASRLLTVLSGRARELYVFIHELKLNRQRWGRGSVYRQLIRRTNEFH
jgi:hypothetical protein